MEDILSETKQLLEQAIANPKELRAQIERKLAILLADPQTPQSFKEAFLETGEER
jgi:hypothetical protein